MKRLALAGIFLLAFGACPAPSPKPDPVPINPSPPTCATDDATHDLCTDAIVTALQTTTDLSDQVTRCSLTLVVCLVHEIVADARSAPQTVGRAQIWLSTHEGAP